MTVSAQPSKDSIRLLRSTALRVLAAADSGRVYQRQAAQLKIDIDILNQRIAQKEEIIKGLETKDSVNSKIINSYTSEIAVMKEQRAVFERALKENEKTIRKLNRKVRWVSIFGLAGVGTLGFLYLTK